MIPQVQALARLRAEAQCKVLTPRRLAVLITPRQQRWRTSYLTCALLRYSRRIRRMSMMATEASSNARSCRSLRRGAQGVCCQVTKRARSSAAGSQCSEMGTQMPQTMPRGTPQQHVHNTLLVMAQHKHHVFEPARCSLASGRCRLRRRDGRERCSAKDHDTSVRWMHC